MKHSLKITLILTAFFLVAQFLGLGIVHSYIDHEQTIATGETQFKQLPHDIERPQINPNFSYLYLTLAILLGTGLLLLLIKFRMNRLWRVWFLLAVIIGLMFAFGAFVPAWLATLLAIVLGTWKIFKPNIFVHNFTELFIYGGLAAMLVPVITISSGIILLLIISVYDAYAVWKSKHMVKLAKFQTKAKIFAGLLIPYGRPIKKKQVKGNKKIKKEVISAVLGGGDVAFPLIFAGVVMTSSVPAAFVISICATIALFCLLTFSKKDRFYPAMPFLTAGCLFGYLISYLFIGI